MRSINISHVLKRGKNVKKNVTDEESLEMQLKWRMKRITCLDYSSMTPIHMYTVLIWSDINNVLDFEHRQEQKKCQIEILYECHGSCLELSTDYCQKSYVVQYSAHLKWNLTYPKFQFYAKTDDLIHVQLYKGN